MMSEQHATKRNEAPTGDGQARGGLAAQAAALWGMMRDYLRLGRWRRSEPVADRASLQRFLNTRSSYVAQMSLYGYLRTRAGVRYPELFHDDVFIKMLNVAKWQVWLACLSDLSVFAGGLLAERVPAAREKAGKLIQGLVNDILDETGIPQEAGPEFAANADRVRQRLAACDWTLDTDNEEAVFTESPPALVHWAPIVDQLKELDEEIVRNSIRFRWQQVRRDLRELLRASEVLSS